LNDGVTVSYETSSTWGAPLNGGGFATAASIVDWEVDAGAAYESITSAHSMEKVGVLWGAGSAASQTMDLTCTSCHDPHGSSNYRLLKDSVNDNPVGGYTNGAPNAFVFSTEAGYPYAEGGWLKGEMGATQISGYVPNYTSGSSQIRNGTAGTSMSAWCSACHEEYDEQSSSYDYGSYEGFQNGGTGVSAQTRHRHPVDMALSAGDLILNVIPQEDGVTDRKIPLEDPANGNPRGGNVGCLTCHYAHGSNAEMTGWSAAHLEEINGIWAPVRDNIAGVEPAKADVYALAVGQVEDAGTSALLRADERGVCQRCHDK
jgi:cytochrome c553